MSAKKKGPLFPIRVNGLLTYCFLFYPVLIERSAFRALL